MAADGALGVIAGGGQLPVALAEHLRGAGMPYFVIRLSDLANPELRAHPGADLPVGALGGVVAALRAADCRRLVLAGNVPRPDFAAFAPDARMQAALPRIVAAAREGDDALLRAVAAELEAEGFTLLAVEQVLDILRAPEGPLGRHAPDAAALADIGKAAAIAAAIGALDIGQGAVVCAGLVLAVEAQEGTDRMLARVAEMRPAIRGTENARRGVLVKRPKPQQERRIDLPTIGLRTVQGAARAGLAGVAVEAGGCLVVDRDAVVAAADEAGLFVYGFAPDREDGA